MVFNQLISSAVANTRTILVPGKFTFLDYQGSVTFIYETGCSPVYAFRLLQNGERLNQDSILPFKVFKSFHDTYTDITRDARGRVSHWVWTSAFEGIHFVNVEGTSGITFNPAPNNTCLGRQLTSEGATSILNAGRRA